VQSNLGHAAAAFTLDVYGHVTDQMKRESAQRMENNNGQAPKNLWNRCDSRGFSCNKGSKSIFCQVYSQYQIEAQRIEFNLEGRSWF